MNFIHPTKIGNVIIKNNVFFAPMAGISDMTYRRLMKRYGTGLTYTEMISTAGLSRNSKKTKQYLKFTKEEKPISVQLFGNNPEEFSQSVKILKNYNFDIIDINMGCPVRKVIGNESGSALMKNLDPARKIIRETVNASSIPVTVKFRSGWDERSINYLELGKICEEEKVAGICLHPRTRAQKFSGKANWKHIAELKKQVKIPVIGNGDIRTLSDAKKMFKETKCDAIMIGRGAMGNPWLIKSIVKNKEIIPTPKEKIKMYLEHVKIYIEDRKDIQDAALSIREMRKFAAKYLSGFPGASKLRQGVNEIESLKELEKLLNFN
ncbi:tRNA dihydrouridine synthase DusB [bacterium (Candidatus Torokbacteria) CG_4_10_14_0_2_um_filter_35_8]|uniref:tRNA-dihydrouridine synthase n=1 Tax=Candidatus Falkowbacteria bacterium CG23_combo_of_CG06-09_8_20_14_all_41_10 TaxID=1974571 RepID=A0A2G9ZN79_9BACT|nr:MAG: tRNA dihydrouridine synthase DusB [Candidatus Falkowbacteria bacterium CG23_combo_of_CG06-09_8_20_14_all_41_10]PIZ58434.1 MAG: tRNA dihydrouridine synthase DusB [bacterium (Candidatus Torokbacteria) CG_4_10_14_0_2_um_filter_35_8]